jgi:hypothetical protein
MCAWLSWIAADGSDSDEVLRGGVGSALGRGLCSPRGAPRPRAARRQCKHVFVSLSALHYALRAKDAERSLEIARCLKHVPLRYAMRLTLLLAEQNHPLYEAAARRVLVRIVIELDPPMIEVKKLADVLAHVNDSLYWYEAQLALRDVVAQLHRMAQDLSADFDSLAVRPGKGPRRERSADPPGTEDGFLGDLKAALPNPAAQWLDGDG